MFKYLNDIPAEVVFHIESTGKTELLSKYIDTNGESVEKVWKQIKTEHDNISSEDGSNNKAVNLSSEMESLKCQYEAVKYSVIHLRNLYDEDLYQKLIEKGYTFKTDIKKFIENRFTGRDKLFQEDLDRIMRNCEAYIMKIKAIANRLPKPKKSESTVNVFAETVVSYSSFTSLGYVNPSSITLPSYYAMVNLGNSKLKQLKSQNGQEKQNRRRESRQ